MSLHSARAFLREFRVVPVIVLSVIAASACSADMATQPTREEIPEVRQDGNVQVASNGLNLLQSPQPRDPVQIRTRTALGGGSYICSPAGFGRQSRCYSN